MLPSPPLPARLTSYLVGKELHLWANGVTSEAIPVRFGVPEGSLLGLVLFMSLVVYLSSPFTGIDEGDKYGGSVAYADVAWVKLPGTQRQQNAAFVGRPGNQSFHQRRAGLLGRRLRERRGQDCGWREEEGQNPDRGATPRHLSPEPKQALRYSARTTPSDKRGLGRGLPAETLCRAGANMIVGTGVAVWNDCVYCVKFG